MTVYWPDYVESTCRSNYSYFATKDFLISAYHFTAIITVPLSIFTFYTIIRVTPEKMKNMKIPMLIVHFWSTNLDLCYTVYCTPMFFFPGAAGLPMGLFGAIGVPSKWSAYFGQVAIVMMGVNLLLLLENRHSQILMITWKFTRRSSRIIFFTINYTMSFLYILPFYLDDADQIELRKSLLKRIPCPSIEFYEKNTVVLLKGGELLPFLSISSGLIIIAAQTTFFSAHTVYHLNYAKNANLSESTKTLQRKFLSYVVLQMTIPWTVIVGPVVYSLVADSYDYYNQALNNFTMLFMAVHGLLSTCCTLFIIKPYREFVWSIIKGNTNFDANVIWTSTSVKPNAIESTYAGSTTVDNNA